jgi:hypothetical protein
MSTRPRFKIAILDDYQNVALSMADWSAVATRAEITVFSDHLAEREAVVKPNSAAQVNSSHQRSNDYG